MRVLFLSHQPHPAHRVFAHAVGARVKKTPFSSFLDRAKRRRLLTHVYPFLALLYALRVRVREDVLLVDGGSSLYPAVFLKLLRPRLKLVFLDGDLHLRSLDRKGPSAFDRFFLRRIDGVVSVSGANAEAARRLLDAPVEVCHPFVRRMPPRSVEREQAGLFIGRLDPDKEVLSVIRTALSCPHFRKFYVAGDGPLRREVLRLARKHRKLEYVGFVRDVAYWYSKCSFLLHVPSREPFGVTPFEALRCGCYPLVSEGVGSAPLLHPLFVLGRVSPAEVSRRVELLLGDPGRAGDAAESSLKNALSRDKSARRFEKAFSRLLREVSS